MCKDGLMVGAVSAASAAETLSESAAQANTQRSAGKAAVIMIKAIMIQLASTVICNCVRYMAQSIVHSAAALMRN